jgi:cathepsin C
MQQRREFLKSTLPESFDWGQREGILDRTIDQGDCGSCYTVSTVRMMNARRRIAEEAPGAEPFSIAFPLQCSEYNQGCDGGYAFLQSKWSEDVGLIPSKCFQYADKGNGCGAVDKNCVAASGGSYRAANHRYVGGYYGGSDEHEIMLELVQHGPLVVSFEPHDDFMYYSHGVYQSSGEPIHKEWEQVDHAVLLTGYGTDESGTPFWRIQNSWGDWGEKCANGDTGCFRIKRGDNDSGVESIAVAADVVHDSGNALRSFMDSL